MKLSKVAIMALRGSSYAQKQMLAAALNVDVATVYRYIANNHSNLTKAAGMAVIREITGLADTEILDSSEVEGKHTTAA